MKVALVHEFLIQLGGAEKLLGVFHELFPAAPVFTLFYDREKTSRVFDGWDIRTSFLQKIPGALAHYKWFLPLMPRAIESFDLSQYDLILSDSSAFAMGVKRPRGVRHICYCHTPTRYIWENHEEYVASLRQSKIVKFFAHIYIKNHQASWDLQASKRPDFFIANSQTVQNRIKKYYGRDSTVIYPPVDTEFYHAVMEKQNFFLTGARLEPYKKIDLVVRAFNQLGLKLKVVGTGTESMRLRALANENIEFVGRVSDEELRGLYGSAKAFVFPALEDAGLMVLESLSCGTPVIGLGQGGTAEFVRDEANGVLFAEQRVEEIVAAVNKFQTLSFDARHIRESAMPFNRNEFKKKIMDYINSR